MSPFATLLYKACPLAANRWDVICPILLPLEPGPEIPTRGDGSPIAYRRWLKEKGVRDGATA